MTAHTCQLTSCGKPFEAKKKRRFCSAACAKEGVKVDFFCSVCQQNKRVIYLKNRQFCGNECSSLKHRKGVATPLWEARSCQGCTRPFRARSHSARKFCSLECSHAHQALPTAWTEERSNDLRYDCLCKTCGNVFKSPHARRVYCSVECKVQFRRDTREVGDHGLTSSEILAVRSDLETLQSGRCAICRTNLDAEKRVMVDHDHSTGFVRGILCHNCNMGIGHFKDNPDFLRSAAIYVEENSVFAEDLDQR